MSTSLAVSVAQFRTDYTEFADVNRYKDGDITYWLILATTLLDSSRWSTLLTIGVELFTAHNMALEERNKLDGKFGNVPGAQVGPVGSKSTSAGSISYSNGLDPSAGHWNMTNFGVRFWQLAQMVGMGPLQIGIGASPVNGGQAWPGPFTSTLIP